MGMDVIGMFMFLLGAIVGSFLNVCIVRMPHEKSIVMPRSHCVHCKKMIPWYDNIPIISYFILRGKCRFCGEKISVRYFIVELITACVFLGFYQYYTYHGRTILLWPYLFMVSGFIVATFVDFEHRIIPDEISLGGMFLGLLFSCGIPLMHTAHVMFKPYFDSFLIGRILMRSIIAICFLQYIYVLVSSKSYPDLEEILSSFAVLAFLVGDRALEVFLPMLEQTQLKEVVPFILSFDASMIGVLVGGGSIYLMGMLGSILFKKDAMGGGDVKLMAMVGAFMGWEMAILTFFIAPFFGAIYGIAEKIRTKDSYISYGPFLVLGALICLFWGEKIVAWIMRGYGLA